MPADGRVLSETDLRTNEAALTGESLPVSKNADLVLDAAAPLADRVNCVYQGTTVVAGLARALVTATGNSTEVGRIGALTQSLHEEKTPLERRLDELGHRLVWVSLAVAAVIAALGLAQGEPLALMIETAIALAVAAVPRACLRWQPSRWRSACAAWPCVRPWSDGSPPSNRWARRRSCAATRRGRSRPATCPSSRCGPSALP